MLDAAASVAADNLAAAIERRYGAAIVRAGALPRGPPSSATARATAGGT